MPGAVSAQTSDRCFACHLELETSAAVAFRTDLHLIRGLTCADCHGGDSSTDDQDAAMNERAGFIGVPRPDQIPGVCGRCHGSPGTAFTTRYGLDDVLGVFRESAHGGALATGGKAPQCVSCHGVHEIALVSDPRSPVHAKNVAHTCAGCHGETAVLQGIVRIRSMLDSLTAGSMTAEATRERARNRGLGADEASRSLEEVRRSAIETRSLIHGFRFGEIETAARPGLAALARLSAVERAPRRESPARPPSRRPGLMVAAGFVLVLLAWLLVGRAARKRRN